MKCAIIAPSSMLELGSKTNYHLILPQELMRSEEYKNFYVQVSGYKILDNGAAEGVTMPPPDRYHTMAREIGADELVVPDVIGNAYETAELCHWFSRYAMPDEFRYMGVLQGKTVDEVLRCLAVFERTEWIHSVAIPRHLPGRIGPDIRLHFARVIANETRFSSDKIHCLGAFAWPGEVYHLARQDLVRGMDTSLPVNYALAGIKLNPDSHLAREPHADRPEHFFGVAIDRRSSCWERIQHNVRVYLEWAGYTFESEDQEAPGGKL